MAAIVIYMTCPAEDEAERIASVLLEKKLIACANIMGPHAALYRWQGRTERAREFAVIMKTRDTLFEDVKREILGMHSYECPCIVSWPVEHGHMPFLQWVEDETAA